MTGPGSQFETTNADVDANWRWLYRIGGLAAGLLVVVTVLHSGVFFVVGLPETVAEWFELFATNALAGLLAFELLMVTRTSPTRPPASCQQ